jgi:hypothetical protein
VNLKLGFFPEFKGADSVLLAGDAGGVAQLSAALNSFAHSPQIQLPIHSLAQVSPHHPAQLYASRSELPSAPGFHWLCAPDVLPDILGKLSALASSGKGHHYFSLVASRVQLVVSVGEYPSSWWLSPGG